jgi:hypothetical protein
MLRKALTFGAPLSASVSAAAIVQSDKKSDEKQVSQPTKNNLILRPSELPIYSSLVNR